MKPGIGIVKFIIPVWIGCFLLLACNRPMPQPPVTPSLPNLLQKVMNTNTPAPAVQFPTATHTAQGSSTPITLIHTPLLINSPTPWPTQTPKPTSTPFPTLAWCPVEPASSTPTGKLRLVYISQGNLWLQDEGKLAIQLTQSNNISQVSISDDGQAIAFSRQLDERHAELWAMNFDGSHERRLVSSEKLTQLDGSTNALGVLPTLIQWEPGSHHLTFFTYPLYDALWIYQPSIPWLVDTDTGSLSAAPYHGGRILYAPDGKHVVIYSSDGLSLAKIDGGDLKENILPGYHGIGEGESYYHPRPFWASDSSSLQVALPDQNEIYIHGATVSAWHVPVEGKPKALGQWRAFAPSVQFSPDLAKMAYWPLPEGAANDRELHLAKMEGNTAGNAPDTVYIRGALTADFAWSPDSQHFIFQMGDPDRPTYFYYLGDICQRPKPLIENGGGGLATWVDASRFLLEIHEQIAADSWELRLGEIGKEQLDLLGVVSAYDWTILP